VVSPGFSLAVKVDEGRAGCYFGFHALRRTSITQRFHGRQRQQVPQWPAVEAANSCEAVQLM